MRILVYPDYLGIGGSAINAVDLAGAVRDLGHEVAIYSNPGPLEEHIARRGLRVHLAKQPRIPRTPRAIAELLHIARRERVDLIHGYEYYPCLEMYYGPHVVSAIPVVGSVMSMSIPRFLPRAMPLIVGTRSLEEEARARRRGRVALLEPPIDTDENHPALDGSGFKRQHGLEDGLPIVAIVSRIAHEMKLEGLQAAVEAVTGDGTVRARLVVVGGGRAFDVFREEVEAANARAGRRAVVLTGPMVDPRTAYAAADVVVGMGSSMLRGMAFGKPGVVVGERGFCEVVSPATIDRFLRDGFYGVGDGRSAVEPLRRHLSSLLADGRRSSELSAFGRRVVCDRFGLRAAAAWLEGFYAEVVREGIPYAGIAADAIRTSSAIAWEAARVIAGRLRNRVVSRIGAGIG